MPPKPSTTADRILVAGLFPLIIAIPFWSFCTFSEAEGETKCTISAIEPFAMIVAPLAVLIAIFGAPLAILMLVMYLRTARSKVQVLREGRLFEHPYAAIAWIIWSLCLVACLLAIVRVTVPILLG